MSESISADFFIYDWEYHNKRLLEKVIVNGPSLSEQEATELRSELSVLVPELTIQDAQEFLLPVIGGIVLSGLLFFFLGKV
jgi:hypothetical protein